MRQLLYRLAKCQEIIPDTMKKLSPKKEDVIEKSITASALYKTVFTKRGFKI